MSAGEGRHISELLDAAGVEGIHHWEQSGGHGDDDDGEGPPDTTTRAQRAAVAAWVDKHLGEQLIVSSSSIAADTGLRSQIVGKTLSVAEAGRLTGDWFDFTEIGRWRDTEPVKWSFTRVSGDPSTPSPSWTQSKSELVTAVSRAAGIDPPPMYTTPDRNRPRVQMTKRWMREMLRLVCERAEHDLSLSDDEYGNARELEDLSKTECSLLLERETGWTVHGSNSQWNHDICAALHRLVVEEQSLEEVDVA